MVALIFLPVLSQMWVRHCGKADAREESCNPTRDFEHCENHTWRVVVQFSKQLYERQGTTRLQRSLPISAIDHWLRKYKIEAVLYRSRPNVKVVNDEEWLEVVLTFSHEDKVTLLHASGRDGVFAKPFRTKDDQEDVSRIVWLGAEVTLNDALDRCKPVQTMTLGARGWTEGDLVSES